MTDKNKKDKKDKSTEVQQNERDDNLKNTSIPSWVSSLTTGDVKEMRNIQQGFSLDSKKIK